MISSSLNIKKRSANLRCRATKSYKNFSISEFHRNSDELFENLFGYQLRIIYFIGRVPFDALFTLLKIKQYHGLHSL